MSKQTEALKLALEALEEINKLSIGENAICLQAEIDTAMDAIREALAEQPAQQELVALPEGKRLILVDGSFDDLMYWLDRCEDKGHLENCPDLTSPWENFSYEAYTTPPQRTWVGLTDEEIERVCIPLGAAMLSFTEVARAIEAKLKEKNNG